MMTRCPPLAIRTRDSRRDVKAPCGLPCRLLTLGGGLGWSMACLKKAPRSGTARAMQQAALQRLRASVCPSQKEPLLSCTAVRWCSWGMTGHRRRYLIRPTLCPRRCCWTGWSAATMCGRSSARASAGRAASTGSSGAACTSRRRARRTRASELGRGKASPVAAGRARRPWARRGGSMPHDGSRWAASGGVVLPDSLHECPSAQSRHAVPWRRGRCYVAVDERGGVVAERGQECLGGLRKGRRTGYGG